MRGYRLDAADIIRDVVGDWDAFAQGNGGTGADGSAVIGRRLWEMIQGPATQAFLDRIFYDCRRTQTAMGLLYRCDSPLVERMYHMRVMPSAEAELLVSHSLIRSRSQLRAPLRDLAPPTYRQCSQCLACNFGGPWVAAGHFRLPQAAAVVDAVCPACMAAGPQVANDINHEHPTQCG
jgi:hypothetical protein